MSVSSEDLEELLGSLGEEFISASEAEKLSIGNEPSLAKSTLKFLVSKITEKVSKTQRSLIEKVQVSSESPAVSLVTAALKKKGYQLEVSGDKSYTQFIISW